jgi:Tetracyclin repressor-like, C-terminal domain
MLLCGVAYRKFAIERPHLYRLMFGGTSAHGIDAPGRNLLTMTVDEIRVEYAASASSCTSCTDACWPGESLSAQPMTKAWRLRPPRSSGR